MSHTSYDPRELIRSTIGTSKAVNPDSWDEQYVLSITYEGINYDIPIYLSEESLSKDLPSLPLIDVNLMQVDYDPHDIGATTRKQEAYLDIGFYFTVSDEYDAAGFGKAVLDEVLDKVRSYQETCSFGGSSFVNVRGVRLLRNTTEKQVVYQYVIEVYCIYYD